MEDKGVKTPETEFDKWITDFSDDLFSWAFYKVSKKELAEDLVQETFLAAYKSLNKFKGNSSPKTWLFSILNNKIIDHYRKAAKQEITIDTSESHQMFATTESFFDEKGNWSEIGKNASWGNDVHLLDDEDFNRIMSMCMEHLPENWNKAVSFKYILEKEAQEICQELNITLSNYWQVIHRAKLMLKKCLEINYFKKMA